MCCKASVFIFHLFSFCCPCVLTHLFVVEAVVRIFVRVLLQYEVSKPPYSLGSHPLTRVQILLLRTMLLDHCPQSQTFSLHYKAI